MQYEQISSAVAKAAPVPPAVVGVTQWTGIVDWDTTVKIVTVVYFVILAAYQIWKWRKEMRIDREARKGEPGE